MFEKIISPTFSLQPIQLPNSHKSTVKIYLAYESEHHPQINGNKIFKLKQNIAEFAHSGCECILTFGGAFSNHIAATAALCHHLHIPCIALIRGEELHPQSNLTLATAFRYGMQLVFVSRSEYAQRYEEKFLTSLQQQYKCYIIPEGGNNNYGMLGCNEIPHLVPMPYNYFVLPVGTGTTIAGVVPSLHAEALAIGIVVHKGLSQVEHNIAKLWRDNAPHYMQRLKLVADFHFGGFGRVSKELENFCTTFFHCNHRMIEPIYTGKMMWALNEMLAMQFFEPRKTIVCLHTGGLQYLPS